MQPIVLYGATGFTGSLTARALHARGTPLVLAGRNRAKLDALAAELGGAEVRVADASKPDELMAAFAGAGCVASTAGPFTRVGWPVVEAAVDAGAHYVDSTGEQAFAHRVRDELGDAARERGATLVSMLAFEYALGDLAADLMLRDRGAEALHVLYKVSHGVASAGTKKSILRVASRPNRQFIQGRLVKEPVARETRRFRLDDRTLDAFSFPGGEPLTVPRHTRVRTVRTYMAARPATVRRMQLLAPVGRALLRGPVLRLLEERVDRAHEDPTLEGRRRTRFTVLLEADGAGEPARWEVTGHDPYGLTAELLAEGATRLARGDGRALGAVAPAEAFDAAAFLDAVAERAPRLRYGPSG